MKPAPPEDRTRYCHAYRLSTMRCVYCDKPYSREDWSPLPAASSQQLEASD